MGWDVERFPEGEVNLELICCICTCILEDPVESPCRHVFCSTCIKTWLSNQKSCPHCRAPVHKKDLKSVVPLLKNIISKQRIYCDNKEEGCPEIVTLERLSSHSAVCEFKVVPCLNEGCMMKVCRQDLKAHIEVCSKRTVLCEQGCDMFLTLGDRTSHNCVQALRAHFQEVTNEMQDRISKLEELVNVLVTKSNTTHNTDISQSRNDISADSFGSVTYSIPSPRSFAPPPFTVFSQNATNHVTNVSAESNEFSDSVESVDSDTTVIVDQQHDEQHDVDSAGIVPYSSVVHADDYNMRSQPSGRQTRIEQRNMSPSYRRLSPDNISYESRGRNNNNNSSNNNNNTDVQETFEARVRDRERTERIRDTERTSTIRSRSSHSRRRSDPYVRPRPSSTTSRSRDSRTERESRSYPYYEREARRGAVGSTNSGSGGSNSGANNTTAHQEDGNQEPLILRIGVSSQTVTDSSTSSASSTDTETEE